MRKNILFIFLLSIVIVGFSQENLRDYPIRLDVMYGDTIFSYDAFCFSGGDSIVFVKLVEKLGKNSYGEWSCPNENAIITKVSKEKPYRFSLFAKCIDTFFKANYPILIRKTYFFNEDWKFNSILIRKKIGFKVRSYHRYPKIQQAIEKKYKERYSTKS